MPITAAQIADFEVYARNPETWTFAAKRSLAVARLLDSRVQALRVQPTRDLFEFAGCLLSADLHAALAVENAVKGVYIKRDPVIVSNGRLRLPAVFGSSGHALLDPMVGVLGQLTDPERRLVVKLRESGWAGRFVVPVRAESLYDEEKLQIMRTSSPEEFPMIESLVSRLLSLLVPNAA